MAVGRRVLHINYPTAGVKDSRRNIGVILAPANGATNTNVGSAENGIQSGVTVLNNDLVGADSSKQSGSLFVERVCLACPSWCAD